MCIIYIYHRMYVLDHNEIHFLKTNCALMVYKHLHNSMAYVKKKNTDISIIDDILTYLNNTFEFP